MARRWMARAVAACVVTSMAAAIEGGCTFGSIADYAVEGCDPRAASRSEDVCERLNRGDAKGCMPFRCDVATRKCVRAPRDDDRDGDPSEACGGRDCADEDRALVEGRPTPPSELWRASDVGGMGEMSLTQSSGRPVAAFVARESQGKCIRAVALGEVGREIANGNGCALLGNSLLFVPRQPFAQLFPNGLVAAFVANAACPAGALGMAFSVGAQQAQGVGPCGVGVNMPAMVATEAGTALVAYYATPVAESVTLANDCAQMKAAPLALVTVSEIGSQPRFSVPSILGDEALSVRPPALLSIPELGGALIASPNGESVSAWFVANDGQVSPGIFANELRSARGVVLGRHVDGGRIRVALVAEIGCAPQAIVGIFGELDPLSKRLSFSRMATLVERGAGIAIQPSVAWVGDRWMVSWISDGPRAVRRSYRPELDELGAVREVAVGVSEAMVREDGSAVVRRPGGADPDALYRAPPGCR